MAEQAETAEQAESVEQAETVVSWRTATHRALYGDGGFFTRVDPPGWSGFRTSARSPLFANAIAALLSTTDDALGHPDPLAVVDLGAGGGQLLRQLADLVPADLGRRLRLHAVDLAPRPRDLPMGITWAAELPPATSIVGLIIATEWLDNIPIDIAELDPTSAPRRVLVDLVSGTEHLGDRLPAADLAWIRRWWDRSELTQDARIELGQPRDEAWATAVRSLARGLIVTVDYGHVQGRRPRTGTLTGFRAGREVVPVPDGSCDITAHVAIDAVRASGESAAGQASTLTRQREALGALGLRANRPALDLAARDPAGYLRALCAASEAADLMDPAGLGGHYWLLQPVRLPVGALPMAFRPDRHLAR